MQQSRGYGSGQALGSTAVAQEGIAIARVRLQLMPGGSALSRSLLRVVVSKLRTDSINRFRWHITVRVRKDQ